MSATDSPVYIVSLQRSCDADNLQNLVSELKKRADDTELPEFNVEVLNVMKSGKFHTHSLLYRFSYSVFM